MGGFRGWFWIGCSSGWLCLTFLQANEKSLSLTNKMTPYRRLFFPLDDGKGMGRDFEQMEYKAYFEEFMGRKIYYHNVLLTGMFAVLSVHIFELLELYQRIDVLLFILQCFFVELYTSFSFQLHLLLNHHHLP